MALQINKAEANRILEAEAVKAQELAFPDSVMEGPTPDAPPTDWEHLIEEFSQACVNSSQTHIAFLGTALLAKSTDVRADAFAVKAKAGTPGAYSARSLGHGVLVPSARLLGFSIGPTGREPLCNMPYFNLQRATLDELLPVVRSNSRDAVQLLCRILEQVDQCRSEKEARRALSAYIKVRRRYLPTYPTAPTDLQSISESEFHALVVSITKDGSEGGRRAQAIAAGLLDLFAGEDRVVSGRINDPDRHLPGDVGVKSLLDAKEWERVLEVRAKPISNADLISFAQKCAENGVWKAAILAASTQQENLDATDALSWASSNGVALTVFVGWPEFINQVLFWSGHSNGSSLNLAIAHIRRRLIEIEVSAQTVEEWDTRTSEG